MKKELVPAILVHNYRQLLAEIKEVEPYVKTVHLDVMDGKFVKNRTFADPKKITQFRKRLRIGVHMMVSDPAARIREWAKSGAFRYIFHAEAVKNEAELINLVRMVKASGMKVGAAINPATPVSFLKPVAAELDLVLVMGVIPGWGGQRFAKKVLKKIPLVKKMNRRLLVGVDGGVKLDNARAIISAGADFLVAGTAIFEATNIAAAIQRLKKAMAAGG